MDNELILNSNIGAEIKHDIIYLEINPFTYKDSVKPRLPRKSSKGYDLMKDTNIFFEYAFRMINSSDINLKKFHVEIKIYKGNDRLGGADLDNYSKAILDGITNTKKIWKDDNQVDKLIIERKYFAESNSKIMLIVKECNAT